VGVGLGKRRHRVPAPLLATLSALADRLDAHVAAADGTEAGAGAGAGVGAGARMTGAQVCNALYGLSNPIPI